MNGTDKKTKTPVVISGYGKERYINGKESGPHTYTCQICGISGINSVYRYNRHMRERHGIDSCVSSEIVEITKITLVSENGKVFPSEKRYLATLKDAEMENL